MSSPFANGSSIPGAMRAAQPYVAPTPAAPQQPADLYWQQSHNNLSREDASIQRAAERQRLVERGRDLAGFVQRDRRAEQLGFVWEQIRASHWPAELPGHIRQAVDQAIVADRNARGALASAEQAFALWHRQHQAATPERARVKFEELTEDLLPAAQRVAEQLDRVLVAAAAIVEAIEHRRAVEAEAPRKRAAIEREYQKQLEQVDRDLQAARLAQQQAISAF